MQGKGLEEVEENLLWQLLGRHSMEGPKALLERHTLLVFVLWKEEVETYVSPSPSPEKTSVTSSAVTDTSLE